MNARRALAALICCIALCACTRAHADSQLQLTPRPSAKPFSPQRELAVGILSGLLASTLATSIALQIVDGNETRGYGCAPTSRFCVFHNLGLYATGYTISGALAVGVALTLAWPTD